MALPFIITVDQPTLDDLQNRLAKTRWPDEIENADWKMGASEAYLQEICTYWQNEFDWKKQEAYLNSFPQFKTQIDGYGIHFIHQKGQGHRSIPLLLTHGWPDSFVRFLKLIPLLTKADENGVSFDVVVPSIPGHGFSDSPTQSGMNAKRIASLFADLMTEELGYEKFIAHGGDVGSEVTEQLALYHADALLGIHLTDIPYHHIMTTDDDKLTKAEKDYKQKITQWQQTEGAYNAVQSTKPQTLAYGLNDSPVGLAAWQLEKFYAWSDCEGDLQNCFTKDELLTNITIYWVTQTANSSARRYNEAMKDMMQEMFNPLVKLNPFDKTGTKADVPTGVAQFQIDLLPPKAFAEKFFNIRQWNKLPKGGHFAAMEQPDLLAEDIRAFVRKLDVDQ
ncbi:epoxide hydrolase family protein [Spirosoma sp. KNUC1025]|uniref:epoxide hydrolase family protein n=1 Tax=Spirosoma sp. KNUC1025 TaxID=2894082 RepID=UPI001E571FD4|nr:epoxide hydrolase family protein [Spirosoma sp. KNUC1025]UFH57770.1 epoxide hydrolase [Spirosoma sp. KNUC1025]